MQNEITQDQWKRIAGEAAVEFIEAGMVIGIGSGSTAAYMIQALPRRLQADLKIVGAVPTSEATEQLARTMGIPLTDLDTYPELDLAIDGADEVDSHLNLIKGGGAALLPGEIAASASRLCNLIADATKRVS